MVNLKNQDDLTRLRTSEPKQGRILGKRLRQKLSKFQKNDSEWSLSSIGDVKSKTSPLKGVGSSATNNRKNCHAKPKPFSTLHGTASVEETVLIITSQDDQWARLQGEMRSSGIVTNFGMRQHLLCGLLRANSDYMDAGNMSQSGEHKQRRGRQQLQKQPRKSGKEEKLKSLEALGSQGWRNIRKPKYPLQPSDINRSQAPLA